VPVNTTIARPLRQVRAPQLLALFRTFDDALVDLDDVGDDADAVADDDG
jgi:hypothetical protein